MTIHELEHGLSILGYTGDYAVIYDAIVSDLVFFYVLLSVRHVQW